MSDATSDAKCDKSPCLTCIIEEVAEIDGLCIFSDEANLDDCGIWDDETAVKLSERLGFTVSRSDKFDDVQKRFEEANAK